ncbi:hypothetical protein BGZ51_001068 [Haplosporangium sp. Z 767]|nr:hypothetical protein BGZ51_001068 [Haplosporangium sp. Z 767]
MEQSDEALARMLQEEEYKTAQGSDSRGETNAMSPLVANDTDVNGAEVLLDLDAEAPFKDLHGLFLAFNDQFFESKLSACEVRWSPRMTRWSQYCSIRLSEPLLKFRPESDYIDTLLHEMIHAYLFVTKAIQDHDSHGADFQYHMNRINKQAGTTITIYHTFHDEVRHYQTHVWKSPHLYIYRDPYWVGFLNVRPPQPADSWFSEHESTCGGTYTKISEPEPTKKKSKPKSQKSTKSEKEQPVGRTLLDDFLSGGKPSSPSATLTSMPSSIPSAIKTTPTMELAVEPVQLIKVETEHSSIKTERQNPASGQEQHHSSPKEAAAAAALARLERRLVSQNGGVSPATTETATKRKDLDHTHPVDLGANGLKKFKTEEPLAIKGESQSALGEQKDSGWFPALIQAPAPSITIELDDEPLYQRVHVSTSAETNMLVQCPVCSDQVEGTAINDHMDLCLWRMSGEAD